MPPDLISAMPPIAADEYDGAAVRLAIRRERADRQARARGRWWFPLVVTLMVVSGCWGLLRADQWIADELIWPTRGAQFVEVGPLPADPSGTGGRMMIVAAGLNRKSGTGVAAALMPALAGGNTRVFSLVYGSGINDDDIVEKFDALIAQYHPREVSYFGSSMGGDVVLNLAAHTQDLRADYRRTLIASPDAAAKAVPLRPQAQRDERVGGQADAVATLLLSPAQRVGTVGTVGSSMGSLQPVRTLTAVGVPLNLPPPRLGIIFLDCSPLGVDDVRDASRASADALTALMEALDNEGGVAVRMAAELLGQQQQWSAGRFPFVQVRGADLDYKFSQVWREKIGAPGISTNLIKDQYGVIRRLDFDDIVESLGPGTRIVYFLPEHRHDDRTIHVEQVEATLLQKADEKNLDVQIVEIPDGHHASAESNSASYLSALDAIAVGGA